MTAQQLTSPVHDWHTVPVSDLLARLQTTDAGLTSQEAAARREKYGPNELPVEPPPTFLAVFIQQFKNPLIYILAVAGAVSLTVKEPADASFIFAVLIINAVIGAIQEWRAEKSSRALQHLIRTIALVERDGEPEEVDASELVPGDIVLLESGIRVPADIRLLNAQGLDVDESLLTGESLPVHKDESLQPPASAPLSDQHNMVWAGSIVVRGRARGLVIATGAETTVGVLAVAVHGSAGGKPPLMIRMERFTHAIGIAVVAASVVVGLLGMLLQGLNLTETFMLAVALAVSAIPEGLPVALTVALAVAMHRMARRGVIVRRLAAVEGLGSCSLIASDKTGTLTVNELTVRRLLLADGRHLEISGEGYNPDGEFLDSSGSALDPAKDAALYHAARCALLCNEADLHRKGGTWVWHGDPTEVALLAFAYKAGLKRVELREQYPQIQQIPFEAEIQYSATFHKTPDGRTLVLVKGAPERILGMSALSAEERQKLISAAEAFASEGYRVLALADREQVEPPAHEDEVPDPEELNFLGFVALMDPLRPGVTDAIAACHKAGVAVTMITGDHPVTALAISRELGLAGQADEVMSGPELAQVPAEEIPPLIDRVRVFARVTPQQKHQIVEAAKKAGRFVAVTGDGVNDAPALRAASIGVAMGKSGTDVAREAAPLVISDDNFATIVAGIEEGRVAYDNIRKVINLLISTGAAEVIMVLGTLLMGLPLPLLPVQILWLNLVTNGIQHIGLVVEPKEGDVLSRPPRATNEPIFNKLMIERVVVAALVMGIGSIIVFNLMLKQGMEIAMARNVVLLLMVLFENVHVGNCRSETQSIFALSPLRSPVLLIGVLGAFGVHYGALHWEWARRTLGTAPVTPDVWQLVIITALSVAVVVELHKIWWRRRYPPAATAT